MSEARHIPNLTIQHYPKTAEGQSMVGSQEPFCIGAKIYQGFKGAIATSDERLLSDDEVKAVHDIDGTMEAVFANRAARKHSRQYRKDEELTRRDNVKKEQRLKDLQLLEAEADAAERLAKANAEIGVGHSPFPAIPHPSAVCSEPDCGKQSPAGHKNPIGWLAGHKMGAHKKAK